MTDARIQTVILLTGIFLYLAAAGCIAPQTTPNPVQDSQVTKITQTPASTFVPQARWVGASIEHFVLNPWDTCSFEARAAGTTDPVTYSIVTIDDAKAGNFQNVLLTGSSSTPASDGSYRFSFPIDPKTTPVGSYVIFLKLSNGEITKLQFLVEAEGVDCGKICDEPGPSIRYNSKGEAICPC